MSKASAYSEGDRGQSTRWNDYADSVHLPFDYIPRPVYGIHRVFLGETKISNRLLYIGNPLQERGRALPKRETNTTI